MHISAQLALCAFTQSRIPSLGIVLPAHSGGTHPPLLPPLINTIPHRHS